MHASVNMERPAAALMLAFCLIGCANLWQFDDLLPAPDDARANPGDADDASNAADVALQAPAAAIAVAPPTALPSASPAPDAASEIDAGPSQQGASNDTGGPACSGPRIACNDQCINPKNDDHHCGGCNIACMAGASCKHGVCVAN
jgi:hypothetical protein